VAAAVILGLDPEPCPHSSQTLNVQSAIEMARTNSLRRDLKIKELDSEANCDEEVGNQNEDDKVGIEDEGDELLETKDEETQFEIPEVIQFKKIQTNEKRKKIGDALTSAGEREIKADIIGGKVIILQ